MIQSKFTGEMPQIPFRVREKDERLLSFLSFCSLGPFMKGFLFVISPKIKICSRDRKWFSIFLPYLSDTLKKTKYNLSGVFESGMMAYYSENRNVKNNWFGRKDFQLNTSGTTYPSDKLSLNIANLTKFKRMRWFNMFFQLNGKYDIEVLFEDSKRNSQHY